MRKVLIIGGGFGGALVATHLLQSNGAFEIIMVDKKGSQGRGVAYASGSSVPLLNVHTGSMSAFSDRPNHFLDWLRKFQPHATEAGFAPRTLYGDYLEWVLNTAISENTTGSFQRMVDEVIDVESLMEDGRTKYRAYLRGGQEILVDAVVLAIGNFPPASIPGTTKEVESHTGYFGNPWEATWARELERVRSLAIIGTGLTATDVILEVSSRPEFTGSICAISRHGRLPLSHAPGVPHHGNSPFLGSRPNLRQMTSILRDQAQERLKGGGHWQDVMNDIRPTVGQLWQSLSIKEQKRFLRHLRSHWDLHRHRIAPQVGDALSRLRDTGKLTVLAARVSGITARGNQLELDCRVPGANQRDLLAVDRVINCSGPLVQINMLDSDILHALFARGIAVPDVHGMGIRCNNKGALISMRGDNVPIFTMGSCRRGELWESIAVRELRVQAKLIADEIISWVRWSDDDCSNVACCANGPG